MDGILIGVLVALALPVIYFAVPKSAKTADGKPFKFEGYNDDNDWIDLGDPIRHYLDELNDED